MQKTKLTLIGLIIVLISLLFCPQTILAKPNIIPQSAEEAISLAQNNNQYLFLLFYDKKDEAFKSMEGMVNDFKSKASQNILFHKVLTTDKKEQGIIAKYEINRAPLPVLLVFAPDGAITGGFTSGKVTKQQLINCLVSKLTAQILKNLQEGKLVLVLLQNNKTKFNTESTKAATDFSNDAQLKGYVEIITTDPNNPQGSEFISQLKLTASITEATIVFLVPPGTIGGIYTGKVTKETLLGALSKCSSGGGSGCCPK